MGTVAVIRADELLTALTDRGYGAFTGVPCSYLKGVFALLEETGSYTAAPHEGIALALSVGNELAGVPTAVFLQNSGLGNLINPLTSLVLPYRIPALFFVSLRGWPTAEDDEPHHEVMGRSTAGLLAAVGVDTAMLDGTHDNLMGVLDRAEHHRARGLPFAILAAKGSFGSAERVTGARNAGPEEPELSPETVIGAVTAKFPAAFVVSSTGLISRELFRQNDSAQRFYMQGSMGHAIGIGLGLARSRPDQRIVVLDGDGSALMHLGGAALVGGLSPRNLLHIVLDNGTYESTGGQSTAPASRDWEAIAAGLSYRSGAVCATDKELETALESSAEHDGPGLIGCRVRSHRDHLPRISERWSNPEIFARAQRDLPSRQRRAEA